MLQFSKEDVLLDIGCSYGQITATLAPHVKRAYGVDVSGTNINIAKKKFAHIQNLSFHQLDANNYTAINNLEFARENRTSRIICISVLQYYKSLDEIRELVSNAKKIASPCCQLVLGDLQIDYNILKDLYGMLRGMCSYGMTLLGAIRCILKAHSMKDFFTNPKELTLKRGDLEGICADLDVQCQFIDTKLTMNWARASAIITL